VKRFGLLIALLLSLGVNVGILTTLGVQRWQQRGGEAVEPAPPIAARLARDGAPPEMGRLISRLGLEGEERRRFLEVQREFFDASREARAQLAVSRSELRRELAAASPDRSRIDILLQQTAQHTADLERALVENILASREILSPDQERDFLRFVAERLRPRRLTGRAGQRLEREPGQPLREPPPPQP